MIIIDRHNGNDHVQHVGKLQMKDKYINLGTHH